jgi:hypothetical protein
MSQVDEHELLKAAENLFALMLGLIQKSLQESTEQTPPSLLSMLAQGSATKKRVYRYGRKTEIPLEEIREGEWPLKETSGEWPRKGDIFYRYDKKTKTAKGFVWNSSKFSVPKTELKFIFKTAEEAMAKKNKRHYVATPKVLAALKKARAKRLENLKNK